MAQFFESPFYALALRGVEEALTQAGYGLVVSSGHWNADEERRCVLHLRARQVDGIILLTGRLEDDYLAALAQELAVVVTGRDLVAPGLHALRTRDEAGARAATRHLVDLGHRRIAHLAGDPQHPDALDREQGYRQALAEAGIPVDERLVVPGQYLECGGANATALLLERDVPFTAIFAANDQMAAGAAQVLHRRGLRIPQDVSIVGFDDLLATKHASPPTTTVNLSVTELGRRAVAAMLDLLADRPPTASAPEPALVVRESTARCQGTAGQS